LPLSRLKPPAKSYVQPRSRFVGLPRAFAAVHLFPSSEPASLSSYRPLNQLRPGSSFRGSSSSSEFLRSNLPLLSCDASKPTQGLVPHRGITKARPLPARDTKPSLRSVLRFSQPLDGFLRPLAQRAYSIPLPRPGLSPFRGFSPRAAAAPHRGHVPPCRCLLERSPSLAPRVRFRVRRDRRLPRFVKPRLRGFRPREGALCTVWG
jgi:hypothetical protein